MQYFRNVLYASDRSGTFLWRRGWPMNSINCIAQASGIQADYSQTLIIDPSFYEEMSSVTIQRWISDRHREIVEKRLRPCMDRAHGWLIYEIDDMMSDKYIPLFNRGRKAFEGEKVQADIKAMLDMSDFITVTTDYIKDSYHRTYGIPKDKIVALPNMLPRYLFDDRFDPRRKLEQFKHFKAKPRIGVVSSLSHYNLDDVRVSPDGLAVRKKTEKDEKGVEIVKWIDEAGKEIPESDAKVINDDLDIIVDAIRATVNEFQWVFFGYAPPKLKDLIDAKKIEVHGGSPIMNYASRFDNLCLQAVVAPIQDIEFNRCKSFIKYMECAALGVPLFASDALPYNRVMPKSQLFTKGDDLTDKLRKLKFTSPGAYEKMIVQQYRWLNSPCHEGDFDLRNFWLEDNLSIWIDLFRLKPKCAELSMKAFLVAKEKAEEEKKKKEADALYSDGNGVEILR